MFLQHLHLTQFRNIPEAHHHFTGRRIFFRGANGQGKTNLLEAIGYATLMRSFRTSDYHHLMRHGASETGLRYVFGVDAGERGEEGELEIHLRPKGRELRLDGEKVARLGEVAGRFPTVVFSSQDSQLLRGAPGLRRRWMDMALATHDPHYLSVWRDYQGALQARNALLRRGEGKDAVYGPFEHLLVRHGLALMSLRETYLKRLGTLLAEFYARLSDDREEAGLAYQPGFRVPDPGELENRLRTQRGRDRERGFTREGPHRDDWMLLLNGVSASSFASEGQQRGLVLSLGLAQRSHYAGKHQRQPILLADDILGELDPARRERFWSLLPGQGQIFATGTEVPVLPEQDTWEVMEIRERMRDEG